jgi:putative spermidine/putrescine transport system permease protein
MGRWALRIAAMLTLAFIYIPIMLVVIFSFNANRVASWPPSGFSLEWWQRALESEALREAFVNSLLAATGATIIALILGTLASFAVARFSFFGRDTISLLLVFPIALPGIVTAIALSESFRLFDISLGLTTIIISHATFCVVIAYNNVLARLRRTSRSFEEASGDLYAHSFQTFRFVTLPAMRTALLAGGLLAFALSFDELIVTNFTAGTVQTLPLFILKNVRLGQQAPLTNVAATVAIVLSIIPVYLAERVAGRDTGASR